MSTIRYSGKNVIINIDSTMVSGDLYSEAVLASNFSPEQMGQLLKEAGVFDSLKNMIAPSAYAIPDQDFKALWAKERAPGGQFSNKIVSLKNAVERGMNGKAVLMGLEMLSNSGSVAARALFSKYKVILDAADRKVPQAVEQAPKIIAGLSSEFKKLLNPANKPADFLGTSYDRQNSQYVQ